MSEQWIAAPTRRLEASSTSRMRSTRVIIAALVVVVAMGYLIYTGFQSTSVYYLTVTELKARGPSPSGGTLGDVRVAGIVEDGSVQRSGSDSTVRFVMKDDGGSVPVVYKGMIPDIFGPGIQVVVEGRYQVGTFQATNLLAKCPSKYTAEVPTPVTAR